ncbi:DNA repair protein RAD51 homolog 3-like isoform X2 [Mya arenaria]|uniref:DNA repair protein RAD51 homolog 3-like isoform X2 n=1 Tax=Mya arenaria TaxID=6604 RepID=UPI0022E661E6|nr:DNA repair protein RAD51 homolog 3-like isoform X2 [Mya arenaria]
MEICEISVLPLAPVWKGKLHAAGYRTVEDVTHTQPISISKGLSLEEVECVLEVVERARNQKVRMWTGWELRDRESEGRAIMTFCEQLDVALGGGANCGSLTEICGAPGSGKTQLCMQLVCDVRIPHVFGGLEGEAVYIDTQGGVVIERLVSMATATIQHCQQIAAGETDQYVVAALSEMSVDRLLSGIHILSCTTHIQLLAIISQLPHFLHAHRKVQLVVVDSISFHFRSSFEDLSLRTRVLTNLAQSLQSCARKFNIAVVVTNQMTTRVSEDGARVVPCLGESWAHACTTRLLLQGSGYAFLLKSPTNKQTLAHFQITESGIRDVASDSNNVLERDVDSTCIGKMEDMNMENPTKRQKVS